MKNYYLKEVAISCHLGYLLWVFDGIILSCFPHQVPMKIILKQSSIHFSEAKTDNE
jgi:hypothetical protein